VVLSARWHYFVNSKKGDFQSGPTRNINKKIE